MVKITLSGPAGSGKTRIGNCIIDFLKKEFSQKTVVRVESDEPMKVQRDCDFLIIETQKKV